WAEGFTGWASNTFCLSAGRNGYVETPFASAGYQYAPGNFAWNGDANYAGGLIRGGDDFVYVISGGSR
ncbi:MAG: hypothetical protein NTY02_14425, partial [Acidobacteria bacterium]|nr:hypothetical protein [Acidobacteriota bacterium]